ncbi:hypothetical protein ARMGADRAFT_42226 [Armillaria gallica]|uniref:Uncharacterized protein n=1 Tax=Armillaria gallica TaxID=47427 RepID=A0A2H3ENF2_ARMGA|nr:hypothetical protein ARMGADRAFT_42226 [Armillaria gallica]
MASQIKGSKSPLSSIVIYRSQKLVDESRKYQPNREAMQHSHLSTSSESTRERQICPQPPSQLPLRHYLSDVPQQTMLDTSPRPTPHSLFTTGKSWQDTTLLPSAVGAFFADASEARNLIAWHVFHGQRWSRSELVEGRMRRAENDVSTTPLHLLPLLDWSLSLAAHQIHCHLAPRTS